MCVTDVLQMALKASTVNFPAKIQFYSSTVISYWQVTFSIRTNVLLLVLLLVYRNGPSHLKKFPVFVWLVIYIPSGYWRPSLPCPLPFSANLPRTYLEKISCWAENLFELKTSSTWVYKRCPPKEKGCLKTFWRISMTLGVFRGCLDETLRKWRRM